MFLLFIALPSLLAIGFSCITWNSLSRPWLFVILSTVILNIMYALVALYYGPGANTFLEYRDPASVSGDKPLLGADPVFMIQCSVAAILLLLVAGYFFRKTT
ncbi:hypothetical protein hmeg3_03600 [Herbaspirillum sp. meg3]|uniref:hypothetical protein n=1 Tax=Herbaspirillum sp. meg3 TaxID=2025949 RepID=UPI000B99BDD7|nr:hypothetical protein [Herbaspirillum sp. meg3]ASU37473.1 hypothetical protein hmeg3_03600 [Herbaspirillum sp. meg3]